MPRCTAGSRFAGADAVVLSAIRSVGFEPADPERLKVDCFQHVSDIGFRQLVGFVCQRIGACFTGIRIFR